ncbi:MAG: hypothetical protein ACPGQV_06470 [Alphaproteobacteria bacterium]
MAAAKAALKSLQADLARKSKLGKRGDVAVATLDTSRAELASGQATVLVSAAELRLAKIDLSYTKVTSPIAGKISRVRYSIANLVDQNSEPLATVTPILGPLSIKRYNQFQSANINVSATQGVITGEVIAAIERTAADKLPEG